MKKSKIVLLLLFVVSISISFILTKKKKKPLSFNPKMIEKSLGEVQADLFASQYEVNNLFYREFLNEHKGQANLLAKAKIHNENWNARAPQYGEPFVSNYDKHPAYDDYPVVNITQEGAQLFCQWLTDKYNAAPKRKYKKVQFRLPTEAEWKLAARAGREHAPFPWGGYYVRNAKGEFLANFLPIPQTAFRYDRNTKQISLVDQHLLNRNIVPAPVETFYPNDFGLYNMSGNVAEMLAETGRTKGGSWNSTAYYIQIDAEDEFEGFTGSSFDIGFRYFMEVLEN